jgi:hypothetical protein
MCRPATSLIHVLCGGYSLCFQSLLETLLSFYNWYVIVVKWVPTNQPMVVFGWHLLKSVLGVSIMGREIAIILCTSICSPSPDTFGSWKRRRSKKVFILFGLSSVSSKYLSTKDAMKSLGIQKQRGKSWTIDAMGNYHVSCKISHKRIVDTFRNFIQIIHPIQILKNCREMERTRC